MEMSIDKSKQSLSYYQKLFNSLNGDYKLSQVQAAELSHSIGTVLDAMRRYQMIELDHKADMVSMLTEIQLEIREYHEIGCDEDCHNCRMVGCVEPVNVIKDLDIIQQKIDALKGN